MWRSHIDTFAGLGDQTEEKLNDLLTEDKRKLDEHVKHYRGEDILAHPDTLEGKVFRGKEAVDLGLIDGLGSYQYVLMKKFPDGNINFIRSAYEIEQLLFLLRISTTLGKPSSSSLILPDLLDC